VKFVRCSNLHLSPYQQFREEIKAGKEVSCPQCGSALRPHVLFFDESYGPLYGE
jgi:NAD-dependent SIR2 family protein deacetylase